MDISNQQINTEQRVNRKDVDKKHIFIKIIRKLGIVILDLYAQAKKNSIRIKIHRMKPRIYIIRLYLLICICYRKSV